VRRRDARQVGWQTGHSAYYACRVHEIQPQRCPGVSVKVALLDMATWMGVLQTLLHPGSLEELARAQAALDTAENPSSRLSQLKQTRDALQKKRDNLIDSLELADDRDTRATLLARAKELGGMIGEADRDLGAYQRLATDWEAKTAILRNVQYQMTRYAEKGQCAATRQSRRRALHPQHSHRARRAPHRASRGGRQGRGGSRLSPWRGHDETVVPGGGD
jgi:hypothetical protein